MCWYTWRLVSDLQLFKLQSVYCEFLNKSVAYAFDWFQERRLMSKERRKGVMDTVLGMKLAQNRREIQKTLYKTL